MANINQVNLDYIKRWEGGLSKDSRDQAAKDPVPDGKGYHTNKGVTWTTFKAMGPVLGYVPTPALFYQMPDNIWLGIYKRGFWDIVQGDKINSQAIAELCADWVWGTGGYAISLIQKELNKMGASLPGTTTFGPLTLKAMNDLIKSKGEKYVFEQLINARKQFLINLASNPAYSAFKTGWINRVNDFYNFAKNKLGNNPVIPIGLLLVGIGALLYLGFKNGDLKQTFGVSKEKALLTTGGLV
jgi:lysozyme family protein